MKSFFSKIKYGEAVYNLDITLEKPKKLHDDDEKNYIFLTKAFPQKMHITKKGFILPNKEEGLKTIDAKIDFDKNRTAIIYLEFFTGSCMDEISESEQPHRILKLELSDGFEIGVFRKNSKPYLNSGLNKLIEMYK